MKQTFRDFVFVLLLLAVTTPIRGRAEEKSSEPETVEYHYELATSPDAHLVYEDTYYFEIISPHSLSYTYKLRQAKNFGVGFDREYKNVRLVVADPVEACRPVLNNIANTVVMVLRGGCSFLTKSKFAETAGALAVVIADNDAENDDHMVDMVDDETGRTISIPAMFLMGKDGMMIQRKLMMEGLTEAIINIPVNLTGMAIGTARQPPWTLW